MYNMKIVTLKPSNCYNAPMIHNPLDLIADCVVVVVSKDCWKEYKSSKTFNP